MKKFMFLFFTALLIFVGYLAMDKPQEEKVYQNSQIIQTDLGIPVVLVQDDLPEEVPEDESEGIDLLGIIEKYLDEILGAGVLSAIILLVEAVVNLTPTEKDNSILRKIKKWVGLLAPNRRKGGGTFKDES